MSLPSVEENNEMFDEGPEITAPKPLSAGTKEPLSARTKRPMIVNPNSSDVPKKPRKQIPPRSKVWKHFTRTVADYNQCNCHYCGQLFNCDSASVGTSSMRDHISRCSLYKMSLDGNSQKVLASDSSCNITAIKYDPKLFSRSINEMIVLNELPFSFVESEGFRRFCFNVVLVYKHISRRTATKEIAAMYFQQKTCLKRLLMDDNTRVSLTTDIWTAPTTSYSYMVVTVHWIDANWQLQKRIISFRPIIDHRGATIAAQLLECLDEWGIKKIFTITVDNASGNTTALNIVKDALRMRGSDKMIQDGAFLHMRCCSHILNLIVRDGMEQVNESFVAVRNAIKYVRSSYARLKSFELRVETGKLNRGSLTLD
ncbi:putative AC transposase [Cardamine amara subsp. amara]|uniref:AC transposase n=1 Tax=Cardamine amara subsp. amara TaxID=228776 RepID=A0ABD0ZHG5_CARAN